MPVLGEINLQTYVFIIAYILYRDVRNYLNIIKNKDMHHLQFLSF